MPFKIAQDAAPVDQSHWRWSVWLDASKEELDLIYRTSSLKQAALEGDVEWGKVEAGQSAGLVD